MMFSTFAKWMSKKLGDSHTFLFANFFIIIWLLSGPFFHFSDAWQLVVNTATTIITFLMVFLLQNTQNRDTIAIHLKLDEIIRATKGAHNALLKIEELSDEELQKELEHYENLALRIKKHIKNGQGDIGTPNVPY